MKKIFYAFMTTASIVIVTPAAAQPPTHSGPPVVVPAVIFNGKAVPLPPQRIEWVPGQGVATRETKNMSGKDQLTTTVTAKKMLITPKPVVSTIVTPKVICTKVVGDGKGDWKGFFEAPKDKKVQALSDAIKGLGPKSAAKIVADGGFFKKKPRNWDEFSDEINAAQAKLHLNVAGKILTEFADDNMKALGYFDSETCKTEMVRKDILSFVEEGQELESLSRRFVINVSGAPLLTGEKESFTVTWDGREHSITASSSANTYQNKGERNNPDATVIEMGGTRNRVTPKVDGIKVEAKIVDGKLTYVVSNDGFDADAGGKVRVTIKTSTKGLFKKSAGENTFELQGKSGEFNTGIDGKAGSKYIAQYSVSIIDSPFYNDAHSAQKSETFKP